MATYHEKTRRYLLFSSFAYALVHCSVLLPRWFDQNMPIPLPGISWHEFSEFLCSPLLICSLFVLYSHLLSSVRSSNNNTKNNNNNNNNNGNSMVVYFPFLVCAWVAAYGQGLHMAGNTIHSTISPGQEYNPHNKNPTYKLVYFLDEYLGHHLIFSPLAVMTVLVMYLERINNQPEEVKNSSLSSFLLSFLLFLLSISHGIAWFMGGVEGQTVQTVSLPYSIIITIDFLLQLIIRRKKAGIVAKYFYGVGVSSLILFLLWGWQFGWHFPEFRVLGLGPFSTWLGQFKLVAVRFINRIFNF